MKVNVYVNFAGNTFEAFEFYKSVFGGEFLGVFRFKDMDMEGFEIPAEDQDKLMHIALPLGDSVLMGTDVLESVGQQLTRGNNVHISLHPESKEEADRLFGALSEGGEVGMPMGVQSWGDYFGSCTDKFGTSWMINYSENPQP